MVESLWLRFGGGWGGDGCLGFRWRCSVGEKVDFLANSASEIIEGFTDVGRIVVGFVGVLRAKWLSVECA